MNNFKVLMNGIIKENPTFVLLLHGIGHDIRARMFQRGNFFN